MNYLRTEKWKQQQNLICVTLADPQRHRLASLSRRATLMERFALLLLPTIIIVTVVSSILIIMKDDQAELEGDVEKLLRKPSPRLSNMVRDELLHTPTIIIMLARSPSSRQVRRRNGEGTEATVSKSPRPEILAPVSMRYSAPAPSAPPRRRRGRRRRSTKRCLRGRTWCS